MQSTDNNVKIAKKILAECKNHPKGVEDDGLEDILEVSLAEKEVVVKKMLEKGYLSLEEIDGKKYYFAKEDEGEKKKKLKELSQEEEIIYKLLKEAGNNGCFGEELKKRSNIKNSTNILGSLEKKGLVKSMKPPGDRRKKWFLYEIKPSETFTESSLLNQPDKLESLCVRAMKAIETSREDYLSKIEITSALKASGILDRNITDADVERIMNSLIFDGKVEEFQGYDSANPMYKFSNSDKIRTPRYVYSPCGTCPLNSECVVGGKISPENCPYYSDW